MPRLNASATLSALADVNVEAANDRASWNLNLNLVIEVIFLHVAAAFLALLGQRHVNDFVRFLFRQRATSFEAVFLAALAAGFPGILFGRSLGERRRLTLAATRGFFQKRFELNNPRLELRVLLSQLGDMPLKSGDLAIFPGDDLKELFVGRLGHPGRSRCPLPCGAPHRAINPISIPPGETPRNPGKHSLQATRAARMHHSYRTDRPCGSVRTLNRYLTF